MKFEMEFVLKNKNNIEFNLSICMKIEIMEIISRFIKLLIIN